MRRLQQEPNQLGATGHAAVGEALEHFNLGLEQLNGVTRMVAKKSREGDVVDLLRGLTFDSLEKLSTSAIQGRAPRISLTPRSVLHGIHLSDGFPPEVGPH